MLFRINPFSCISSPSHQLSGRSASVEGLYQRRCRRSYSGHQPIHSAHWNFVTYCCIGSVNVGEFIFLCSSNLFGFTRFCRCCLSGYQKVETHLMIIDSTVTRTSLVADSMSSESSVDIKASLGANHPYISSHQLGQGCFSES